MHIYIYDNDYCDFEKINKSNRLYNKLFKKNKLQRNWRGY